MSLLLLFNQGESTPVVPETGWGARYQIKARDASISAPARPTIEQKTDEAEDE